MEKIIKIYKSNTELFGKYVNCFDTLVNCQRRFDFLSLFFELFANLMKVIGVIC